MARTVPLLSGHGKFVISIEPDDTSMLTAQAVLTWTFYTEDERQAVRPIVLSMYDGLRDNGYRAKVFEQTEQEVEIS